MIQDSSLSTFEKRTLLIINGQPSTGKTTLCRELAKRRPGTFFLDRDNFIWSRFPDRLGEFTDKEHADRVTEAVRREYIEGIMIPAIKDAQNKLVIIDWGFDWEVMGNIEPVSYWAKIAEDEGMEVKVVMTFDRDVPRGLSNLLSRDFADEERANHRDGDRWRRKWLEMSMRMQQNLPSVFDLYCESGMNVNLYEADFTRKPPHRLVAKVENGQVDVKDKRAFAHFRFKEKINADAPAYITSIYDQELGKYSYDCKFEQNDLFPPERLHTRAERWMARTASHSVTHKSWVGLVVG